MITSLGEVQVRETSDADDLDTVWELMLEPAIRAGETYCLPKDITKEGGGLAFWTGAGTSVAHHVFIVERVPPKAELETPEGYTFAIKSRKGAALGSYFLAPNGLGPGAHIARCAMATVPEAAGTDLEAVMLHHVLQTANVCAVDEATPSFRAIVLDNILETNTSAIELYEDTGFEEVGRLPAAFDHPQHGPVDTLTMHRQLGQLMGVDDLAAWLREERAVPARSGEESTKDAEPTVDHSIKDTEAELETFRRVKETTVNEEAPEELDEYGYTESDIFSRFAFHLDTLFSGKPPDSPLTKKKKQRDAGASDAALEELEILYRLKLEAKSEEGKVVRGDADLSLPAVNGEEPLAAAPSEEPASSRSKASSRAPSITSASGKTPKKSPGSGKKVTVNV